MTVLPFRREPDTYHSTSLRPIADDAVDLVASLAAEWAQKDGRLASPPRSRPPGRAALRLAATALRSTIASDLFFIATGALVAADLCLVIYLAGGGR